MSSLSLACLIIGCIVTVTITESYSSASRPCRDNGGNGGRRTINSGDTHYVLDGNCGECGRANLAYLRRMERSRIYGGKTVNPLNKYPWIVAFMHKQAHCILEDLKDIKSTVPMDVVFLDGSKQSVAKFIPHPGFKIVNRRDTLAVHDIGLLKLKKPIQCDSKKSPICLPSSRDKLPGGTKVTISGWGQDYIGPQDAGKAKGLQELQEAEVTVGDDKCSRVPIFKPGRMYCVYGEGKRNACVGDSGGSLVTKKKGKYFTYGIAHAAVRGDCDPRDPTLYFSVTPYLDWITKITGVKPMQKRTTRKNIRDCD